MLTTNEVMAFLATADADAATLFYRDRLGLRLVAETEFALEFEAGEMLTQLRVQKVKGMVAAPYTALGWKVGNIAEKVEALSRRGVGFERFAGLQQDERGIWQSPDGARIAWFKDPDGNILSLTQLPATPAAAEPAQPIT